MHYAFIILSIIGTTSCAINASNHKNVEIMECHSTACLKLNYTDYNVYKPVLKYKHINVVEECIL